MRRLSIVPLLLVALAACGTDYGDNESSSEPEPETTTTLAPDTPVTSPPVDPDTPVEPGGAEPIEPTGNAADVYPISFDPAEAEAEPVDGGVLVRFYGGVAPCYVLDRYEVEETPETVTVTLYGGRDPDAGDVACIELAMQYEVIVPLDEPLGERELIDGSQA